MNSHFASPLVIYGLAGLGAPGQTLFAAIGQGSSALPDPFSKAVGVVAGFLSSIVTKNDFFKARDKLTWEMAVMFQQYFGLDAQAMDQYYWRKITNPGVNEKRVIDDWWKALNDQCIGEASVSPCSDSFLHENLITTHNITGHWKRALEKLEKASKLFLSKYFSQAGTQAQQQLVNDIYAERMVQNQSQPPAKTTYANTSGSWDEIMKKFRSLSNQQKIVVGGGLGLGALFLTIALVKAATD